MELPCDESDDPLDEDPLEDPLHQNPVECPG